MSERIQSARKPFKPTRSAIQDPRAPLPLPPARKLRTWTPPTCQRWAALHPSLGLLINLSVDREDALKFTNVKPAAQHLPASSWTRRNSGAGQGEAWTLQAHARTDRSLPVAGGKGRGFVILTAYAITASAIITRQAVEQIVGKRGQFTTGELVTVEESAGHVLSHAIFTRWQA